MAEVDIHCGYYMDKRWLRVVPALIWRAVIASKLQVHAKIAAAILDSPTTSIKDNSGVAVAEEENDLSMGLGISKYDEDTETDCSWEGLFASNPHSNTKLLELLPKAIKEAKNESMEWNDPESLSGSILEWWKGQKHIIFYDSPLSELEDMVKVLDACLQALHGSQSGKAVAKAIKNSTEKSSLRQVLLGPMKLQDYGLKTRRSPEPDVAKTIHFRFDGRPVALMCAGCYKEAGSISDGKFSIHRPNHFVVTRTKPCPTCNAARKLIPTRIPMIHNSRSSREREGEILAWAFMILPYESLADSKREVKSFCINCREATKLSDGGSIYVDIHPRWTRGIDRSLYVERRAECKTCEEKKQPRGRFIPVDESILSVTTANLDKRIDMFKAVGMTVMKQLLDEMAPSSRVLKRQTSDVKIQSNQSPDAQLHTSTLLPSREVSKDITTTSCPVCHSKLDRHTDDQIQAHVSNCLDRAQRSESNKEDGDSDVDTNPLPPSKRQRLS